MMDPGKMRDLVAIQESAQTAVPGGGYTEAWADVADQDALWAEIKPLRGNEQLRAMQTTASATHRVRMWAIEGVSAAQRIRRHRDGGILQIVAPPVYDETRLGMELLAREEL